MTTANARPPVSGFSPQPLKLRHCSPEPSSRCRHLTFSDPGSSFTPVSAAPCIGVQRATTENTTGVRSGLWDDFFGQMGTTMSIQRPIVTHDPENSETPLGEM